MEIVPSHLRLDRWWSWWWWPRRARSIKSISPASTPIETSRPRNGGGRGRGCPWCSRVLKLRGLGADHFISAPVSRPRIPNGQPAGRGCEDWAHCTFGPYNRWLGVKAMARSRARGHHDTRPRMAVNCAWRVGCVCVCACAVRVPCRFSSSQYSVRAAAPWLLGPLAL